MVVSRIRSFDYMSRSFLHHQSSLPDRDVLFVRDWMSQKGLAGLLHLYQPIIV